MIKIEKYTGTKVYMFPNGAIATPEAMLKQFPAALAFTHIVETDEYGEVCYAVENLAAMKSLYNIDRALSESDAIAAIETMKNAPIPEPEPTAEERIAAAMEFQNMMSLGDTIL